jgi:SAM-dependent methyltransferase
MDGRAMEFEDGSFDLAIDKGTIDAILVMKLLYYPCKCGESSTTNAQKIISEVYRVLGPKGVYFIVSYGLPEHRLSYLEKTEFDWLLTPHY